MTLEWFSITRGLGITAFCISFAASSLRLAKCSEDGAFRRFYSVLCAVQFFLLLDMAFDWRWKLHDFWMRAAMSSGVYEQRRGPQLLAVGILAVALASFSVAILYSMRRRIGAAMAAVGTLLSVGLWATEAISYHSVDSVLYWTAGGSGGPMVVSLAWCALAAITCIGVWMDSRQCAT
jgi:hypothetical protein